jgi:hypothetical protein
MNLACCGLTPNFRKDEWLKAAEDDGRLQRGMERLYSLFKDAPTLGSLIDPYAAGGDLLEADFHELQPLLDVTLERESLDDPAHEMAVVARGLAKAAELLVGKFSLIATNVPYLGRGKQDDTLKEHLERYFPNSKADLATAFVERCLMFCAKGGVTALVTPRNWLFLSTYKRFRESLLKERTWNGVVTLGEEGWWSYGVRGPHTVLLVLSESKSTVSHHHFGIDVGTKQGERVLLLDEKAAMLRGEIPLTIRTLSQVDQLQNPDAAVTLEAASSGTKVQDVAYVGYGSKPGQTARVTRQFWEIAESRGE